MSLPKRKERGWVAGWKKPHPDGGYIRRRLEGSYVAILERGGVVKTKNLPTLPEAMAWLDSLHSLRDGAGTASVASLSASRIEQTAEAVRLLEEAGMGSASIVPAVREWVKANRPLSEGWTVGEAIREQVKRMEAKQCRPRSIASQKGRLSLFGAQYGSTPVPKITKADVDSFLNQFPEGFNRRNFGLAFQSLFNFCEKEMPGGYKNEVAKFPQSKQKEIQAAEILKPDEAKRFLDWMEREGNGKAVLSLAFSFFGGMRTAEICNRKFTWACINLEENIFTVPANVAKTRTFRQVQILPALRAYILKYKEEKDEKNPERKVAISVSKYLQFRKRGVEAIGISFPPNGARHSFGTYRAKVSSYFTAASEMGHRGGIGVFQDHYHGLCSKAEAEQFFAIRPV